MGIDTSANSAPHHAQIAQGNTPAWVACRDTLVCAGAKQIQKWCVREGDEKGPLVAVMLTKEVAHMLAAAPELLEALKIWMKFFETMPSGQFGKISCNIGLMNNGFIKSPAAIAKAEGRG